MSEDKSVRRDQEPELSMEDRLKGLLYQFITLYDRWREDRQIAAKRDAEVAELAEKFAEKVEGFDEVGARMRRDMCDTIEKALIANTKESVKAINENTTGAVDATVKKLASSVDDTQRVLTESQQMIAETRNFKMALIWIAMIAVGAFVGMLVAKFVMPDPVLPLTDRQVYELRLGSVFALAKPKMKKEEVQRIWDLANQAIKEKLSNTNE